jgi:EAL domain-containing protein (putative c-di-GMP-specific phosphodiesterase class I)
VKIAVNVSALQLARSDFAETVARILTEEGVDAGMLELELTESEVMRNWDESSQQMRKLRALGLSIAIDDFGTGYSSLSYMHCLPVDTIKIDQSFVSDIGAKATSLPVVRTIVTLAHQLGLAVVAEGVETEDQLQALREIDCDMVQGFLLQRPAPASALDDVLFERGAPESLSYPVLAI